jgi:AmmeMemoRadiSam system protein A
MPSPSRLLSAEDGRALLALVRASIEHGLRHGCEIAVDAERFAAPLRAPGAAFVTLRRDGELRGCVGELEASRPLVESVARHAFAAAFRDPRFAPVDGDELDALEAHVSVLSPLEPLAATSEPELLDALRPGVDGLLIDDGVHRATFLPAVWSSLPDPHAFLCELRRKAGLPDGSWPPGLRAWRYFAESVPAEPEPARDGSSVPPR